MIKVQHYFLILFLSIATSSFAQQLSYERMSVYAYEEMSDWIRRFPGMYPMDYGVAGAPVIFRPWGLAPWYVGAERDGIPWQRVSDGLYDSNLDSPDELQSLSLEHDRMDPLGTIVLRTRELPTDTATTEVRLREGYYGFGRVDFVHAQRLSKRVTGEGRGRLWWYDGLRSDAGNSISKSRFYTLSGKLNVQLSSLWRARAEYGGANVDAQSPAVFLENGIFQRPQIYSEREYGTLRLEMRADEMEFDFGIHARQDRETRDEYFGLRERYWYGFAATKWRNDHIFLNTKIAIETAQMSYPGLERRSHTAPELGFSTGISLGGFDVSASPAFKPVNERWNEKGNEGIRAFDTNENYAFSDAVFRTRIESPKVLATRLYSHWSIAKAHTPSYWRFASLPVQYRALLIDSLFAETNLNLVPNYGSQRDQVALYGFGVHRTEGRINCDVQVVRIDQSKGAFWALDSNTIFLEQSGPANDHVFPRTWGAMYEITAPATPWLMLDAIGSLQSDPDEIGRIIEQRNFIRLLYSNDFFKAPLHIDSYIAYEHIGVHRAVSEIESKVVGPAHLVHLRIEGTIEGVTLIWGMENLTGQHYEYLPGYMLIRKEEYFGLKWTLKL